VPEGKYATRILATANVTHRAIYDLSVCQSVRKMYCGKTVDWIRVPFGVVNVVGRGMGVLDGVVIVEGEGTVLWINLGRLIVTNGDLLHSCAEVHEPIELSFWEVSGVGLVIRVLNGGPRAPRGKGGFGSFLVPLF